MKTGRRFIAIALVGMLLLGSMAVVAQKTILSPALIAIEKQLTLKKCGIMNSKITFSTEDFDKVLCCEADYIVVEELPEEAMGVLCIGSLKIEDEQIVKRSDFNKIVFYPTSDMQGTAEFVFSSKNEKLTDVCVRCVMNVLDEVNLAPVLSQQSISTIQDVCAVKFLDVFDPEADEMNFEVVSYPSHGTIRISDDSSGYFTYTPQKGYTGKDSFEYIATDKYGNRSRKASVKIDVAKTTGKIYFDDMQNHWAHNSAIRTANIGLMTGGYDEAGRFNFYPEKEVSRGDFLAMALISAGKEKEITFITETSFADDKDIPMNIKSYAEYAKKCGIVSGYVKEDGQTYFDCHKALTRAEAAVIVDRILALPETVVDVSVFADFSSIPSWASKSVSKVQKHNIFNGTGYGEVNSESVVTRAQTAEILCNMADYILE